MVTRKLTKHVYVIGVAITLVEVMLEFQSENKIDIEVDERIEKQKKELEGGKGTLLRLFRYFEAEADGFEG